MQTENSTIVIELMSKLQREKNGRGLERRNVVRSLEHNKNGQMNNTFL